MYLLTFELLQFVNNLTFHSCRKKLQFLHLVSAMNKSMFLISVQVSFLLLFQHWTYYVNGKKYLVKAKTGKKYLVETKTETSTGKFSNRKTTPKTCQIKD